MRIRIHFIILASFLISMTSCFKDELIIPRHPRGNVRTDTIELTETYRNQVYFDLSDSIVRKTNLKNISDIGFECSPGGWKIILNTADFAMVADMGPAGFGEAYDTAGVIWKFDKSNGDVDSLAFGRWFTINGIDTVSNGNLFIVNRGIDENGNFQGLIQLTIDSLKNGKYYFRWAGLDGSDPVSAVISKDPSVNYAWYSFRDGGSVVSAEPPKESWDLLFTQYTTLLFTDLGEAYPYIVTGVLLNPYGVSAVMDTVHSFEEITLETAMGTQLGNALDVIGWEWKEYSFTAGGYTVLFNRHYIIRDSKGIYFKLRFVGYYNAFGAKGYPVIEYQQL